jgi:hypothetical protein
VPRGILTTALFLLAARGCSMRERDPNDVVATVRGSRNSLESVPYSMVIISIENRSAGRIQVHGYRIVWPTDHFEVKDSGVRLEAGEVREIKVRVPWIPPAVTVAQMRVEGLEIRRLR